MALVSYGYSDSGSEGEDEELTEKICLPSLTNGTNEPTNGNGCSNDPNEPVEKTPLQSKLNSWKLPPPKNPLEDKNTTILSTRVTKPTESLSTNDPVQPLKLPTPKSSFASVDWKDILAARSKFQPIKISAPALPQNLEEGEEELRKKKEKKRGPSSKSSGLFSVLPQPKNDGVLTVFKSSSSTNTPSTSNITPITVTTAVKRKKLSEQEIEKLKQSKKRAGLPLKFSQPSKKKDLEDDKDASDEEAPDSFFFTKTDDVEALPIDDEFLEPVKPAAFPVQQPEMVQVPQEMHAVQMMEDETAYSDAPLPLDDSALRALCGGGAKRKKKDLCDVEFIDVSGDALVGDNSLALTKGITDEYRPSRLNSKKFLSSTSARKHQITYLAAQAKELEHELKQQWGANRLTKKQTQSKYGF